MIAESNAILEREVLDVFGTDDLRNIGWWTPKDSYGCDADELLKDYSKLTAHWNTIDDSDAAQLLRARGWTTKPTELTLPKSVTQGSDGGIESPSSGPLVGTTILTTKRNGHTITVALGRYGLDAVLGGVGELNYKLSR